MGGAAHIGQALQLRDPGLVPSVGVSMIAVPWLPRDVIHELPGKGALTVFTSS